MAPPIAQTIGLVDEFAALWQIAMQGVASFACDMLINHGTGLTRFTH
ncbi:hypothetical protein MY8738_000855 [Beauveria namnaoensis]